MQLTPNNKSGFSNLFLDANKKPKILTISIVGIVLVVGFIFAVTKSTTQPQSPSFLDYDYNVPKKQEPQKVTLAPDQNYVSKDEINNLLEQKIRSMSDQQSISTDKDNSDLIAAFNETHQKDLANIQAANDARYSQLQDEIEELKSLVRSGNGGSNERSSQPVGDYSNTFPGNQNNFLPPNDFVDNANMISNGGNGGNSAIVVDNFVARNEPLIVDNGDKLKPGLLIGDGINPGSLINGILKTGAISSAEACPILVTLTEDIKYKDKVLIPKGTNLMGSGVTDYGARKIFMNLNKLILNNREIEIKAHLVNNNGVAGFCSKYVDKSMQRFWPVFLLNFSSGVLQAFKDVSYFTTGTGVPTKIYDDSSKNAAIDGISSGVTEWSNLLMQDAQSQGAIIVVNPNLKVKIFIDEKILLSKFTRKY